MTTQEILELAGHRDVPPWVMKLVADCLEKQRNDLSDKIAQMPFGDTAASFAVWVREQDGNCQRCGGKGCIACDARKVTHDVL